MGFLSFNESYYRRRLAKFEHKPITRADLTEAKQSLKVLDDEEFGLSGLVDKLISDSSDVPRSCRISSARQVELRKSAPG